MGTAQPIPVVDVRIEGGRVVDGTPSGGAPNRVVEIVGDRIAYVGPPRQSRAKKLVDAQGLIVSPGFIDPHTHAVDDLADPISASNLAYLVQGVTTVFVGNDGGVGLVDRVRSRLLPHAIGTHVAIWSGHGSVRQNVLGTTNRAPTPAELVRMKALVRADMEAGALGLSSGLFYTPGSFAKTGEVAALAEVVAEYGGVYESHLRDEADYNIGLIGSIKEAIEIGRRAGVPVHIAHIKALGPSVHGQSTPAIEVIDSARTEGLLVTADQYPWVASGTRLSNALIPRDYLAHGLDHFKRRLKQNDDADALRTAMLANLERRGGANALLITGPSSYRGRTLHALANEDGVDAVDMAIKIVLAGDPAVASFMMNREDVKAFMQQPWVMTSSDGSIGHPRKYGSFPKKYDEYVRHQGLLTLSEFVYRSTGLTASTFGLCNRGVLAAGNIADIVAWHPDRYKANATYELPTELASGIAHAWIAGMHSIALGEPNDNLGGRVIDARDCPRNMARP